MDCAGRRIAQKDGLRRKMDCAGRWIAQGAAALGDKKGGAFGRAAPISFPEI
jgi:hypothetical protein